MVRAEKPSPRVAMRHHNRPPQLLCTANRLLDMLIGVPGAAHLLYFTKVFTIVKRRQKIEQPPWMGYFSAPCPAIARNSSVVFIAQNFGPHMLQ